MSIKYVVTISRRIKRINDAEQIMKYNEYNSIILIIHN